MKRFGLAVAVCSVAFSAVAHADAPTLVQYTVEHDVRCDDLAQQLWGDRTRYDLIHKYNRNLGPAPHLLKAGTILTIPPPTTAGGTESPDARLQVVRNSVSVEAPAPRPGKVHDALYRGNRVATADASSAEIGFRDETDLWLGERSLVVLLGDSRSKVGVSNSASLVSGKLRAFLASTAPSLDVQSGSAHSTVGPGEAQVTVDDKKATRLAVYHGSSSVSASGKTVPVASGYGSKAEFQRAPTPPRPLPLAPAWSTPLAPLYLTDQPTIDVSAEYRDVSPPALHAAAFHVQLARDAAFHDLMVDETVPSNIVQLVAKKLPVGDFFARVSAIDGDEFEGPYSAPTEARVVGLQVVPGPSHAAVFALPPGGAYCGIDGKPPQKIDGSLSVSRTREHRVTCSLDNPPTATTTTVVPADTLHPRVKDAEFRPSARDPRSGELRMTLVDGNGGPLSDISVGVAATDAATVHGELQALGEGRFAIPITCANGANRFALTLRVNGVETAATGPVAIAPRTGARSEPQDEPSNVAFVASFGVGILHTGPRDWSDGDLEPSIGADFLTGLKSSELRVGGRVGFEHVLTSEDVRDFLDVSIPLSVRLGAGRLRPTFGVAPILFRAAAGGSNNTSLAGVDGRVGVETPVGPGALFLDAGYRITTTATTASGELDLSGFVGSIGYRGM